MKTCRSAASETPATTSCRATPSPQSTTYGTPFATTTCAGADDDLRGRGPPPVPRRTRRVFAWVAPAAVDRSVAAPRPTRPASSARRRRSMATPALSLRGEVRILDEADRIAERVGHRRDLDVFADVLNRGDD